MAWGDYNEETNTYEGVGIGTPGQGGQGQQQEAYTNFSDAGRSGNYSSIEQVPGYDAWAAGAPHLTNYGSAGFSAGQSQGQTDSLIAQMTDYMMNPPAPPSAAEQGIANFWEGGGVTNRNTDFGTLANFMTKPGQQVNSSNAVYTYQDGRWGVSDANAEGFDWTQPGYDLEGNRLQDTERGVRQTDDNLWSGGESTSAGTSFDRVSDYLGRNSGQMPKEGQFYTLNEGGSWGMSDSIEGATNAYSSTGQSMAEGKEQRTGMIEAYTDIAGQATDNVMARVRNERANAALMGIDYDISQEVIDERIGGAMFQAGWTDKMQGDLTSVTDTWGADGFEQRYFATDKSTAEGGAEQAATASPAAKPSAMGSTATALDEESLLGA